MVPAGEAVPRRKRCLRSRRRGVASTGAGFDAVHPEIRESDNRAVSVCLLRGPRGIPCSLSGDHGAKGSQVNEHWCGVNVR